MPSLSGAGQGALTGAGIGGTFGGPLGAGIGAGIGGLVGLFKGGKKKKKKEEETPEAGDVAALREAAGEQRQRGAGLGAQGEAAIAPAMGYFQDILRDPQAAMAATKGPRGRVIDQYDAARQAASRFGAKGGGTNAAIAQSYFQQANQLSDITSAAQSDAATQLGQMGATLTGLGLSADQLASADLNTVIQAVLGREQLGLQKRGQTMGLWGDIGTAAGSIIGSTLLRGGGGGGG